MRISHVKISNILGIAELDFSPDGFTEVSGPNGSGKTSVMEAIKSVVSGGHDATLLRNGADKGEIVLVLDDGTQLRKRVTASQSPIDVMIDGKKQGRPTDTIKALTDTLSVNPVAFLHAPKKDRVKVLLETMPVSVDAEALSKLSGVPVQITGKGSISAIEAVRKQVYDDRTGTNRAVKEKEATINQLRLTMPPEKDGIALDGSEDELRQRDKELSDALLAERERIRKKLEGIKADNRARIDQLKTEAQEQIDTIRASLAASIEQIAATEADTERKAAIQGERKTAEFNAAVEPIRDKIKSIVADREASARIEQTKSTIKMLEHDLAQLIEDATAQTTALESIDKYKADLLASLPIPGLVVTDGEIYLNGVVFDRLNTASQVWIAVEIAKLRAKELGIVCVDGLELLDPATFEEFKARALESGLQLFVTRVSGEEFAVNTTDNV